MLDISLIILSAGNSSRFKSKIKKQWLRIGDEPLWLNVANSISSYYDFKKVIITSSKDELFYMKRFCDYEIIEGGSTRQESLKNALESVKSKYVLVSDMARANIPKSLVLDLIQNIDKNDNVTPFLNPCDTVVYNGDTLIREDIKLIQTPQLSLTSSLKNALLGDEEFTDDSSAIKSNGGSVKYIAGDILAKKLTFSGDKEEILKGFKPPRSDVFSGLGYDVHAYEENKKMILGGVVVHPNIGFRAHSDGDVVIHAIIDALLGAIGAGDIGEWFPDTSKEYEGVDSMVLLKDVAGFVSKVGYEIVNIDTTIVAEFPKISPYKQEIAKNIASVLDLCAIRVNIKATTSEKMGFVGKKEGVAVYSIVTVKYFNWMSDENTYS